MRIEFCQGCGAPLEARWSKIVLVCSFCGSQNAPGGAGDPVPSSVPDDGRLRIAVAGRTYLILGKLADGDGSRVYLGRWVKRLGERVVVKVQANSLDGDLLRREYDVLQRLQRNPDPATPHFARRVPEPIGIGPHRFGDAVRLVSVFRWRSGFLHPLPQVLRIHPRGVGPHVAVWIFKRLLELLHWTHGRGIVHGAVLPPHVLIHPRDHGVMLVGWSTAVPWAWGGSSRLPAVSRDWAGWYPHGREASPSTDIAQAARCVLLAADGSAAADPPGLRQPADFPPRLARPLLEAAAARHDNAWQLRQQVAELSRELLGPPAYSPLAMPGWTLASRP